MNIVDPAEIPKAIGLLISGGALVKVLDILLKWHKGKRIDVVSEATKALEIGAHSRAELRRDLEDMRRDWVAERERADACEMELRSAKRQLSAEQRQMRHSEDTLLSVQTRQDIEDKRHSKFSKDERDRRGSEDDKS